jgi:hypothetical protein
VTNSEAIAKLKALILTAQTLGELYALMEDYSYLEFMEVYNHLTPKQQTEIDGICDRDTSNQITAINTQPRGGGAKGLSYAHFVN